MCIYDKDPMYLKIELKLTTTTVTSILKIDGFDWFCKWLFVTPFTSCNVAIDDRKKSLNFLILRKNQANMLDSDISFRDEKVLSFYISWLEISLQCFNIHCFNWQLYFSWPWCITELKEEDNLAQIAIMALNTYVCAYRKQYMLISTVFES